MRSFIKAAAFLVALLCAIVLAALYLTPWPGALLIRYVFDQGAAKASAALEKHVPPQISAQTGLHYDPFDPDGYLDIYRPANPPPSALPLVVWVHGGGFVSGRRSDVANYLKALAGRGFVTVSVDYSIAPGATYPTPLRQLNAALGYLTREGADLGVDSSRLILAGDSAGAQIVAQVSNLATSPAYAQAVGIAPTVKPQNIAGVVLFCGLYDLKAMNTDGPFGLFLKTVIWSYSGSRDGLADPKFALMSVKSHVTPKFPAAFISAGNADPLASHSHALAETLTAQGVRVETLFFPDLYEPRLAHEYQFDLDGEAGRLALDRISAFIRSVAKP